MKNSMLIHPDELSRTWIDKLADAGIETVGIHPRGGKTTFNSLKELLEYLKMPDYRALIDYARDRGLDVEYEIHAAGYLLPRELFASHPEYFRMDENGERTVDRNFCVSNPDALEIVAKRAAELALSLYGSSHRFHFWMDDGHKIHCHCPKCRSVSPSDQQLMVLNRMLQEIQKHLPDACLAYLAYMDTVVPPSFTKPEKGIFLEYAPFEKYTAKGEDAAALIARERDMLVPLMNFFEHSPKKVLEYWYDNSMLSGWKKPPAKFILNREMMQKDIAEYRAQGFDYISTFACFLAEDYKALYGDVSVVPFAECVK